MCTGMEGALLGGLFAGGMSAVTASQQSTPAPQVVRESPLADQAKIESQAAATAAAARTSRRRRIRSSSLLATGGAGDPRDVITGQPTATAGKSTLGA